MTRPQRPLDRFRALVARPDPPLGEGCLLIAAHVGHPAPVEEGEAALAALAEATGERLVAEGRAPDLDGVAAHLFGAGGFAGDRVRYHDPRNSLLPEVLARRRGIPITLSVVVIEVAGRLGVPATGVGMPGHFLVGDGRAPRRWLDAFDGGAWLDVVGAEERFRAVHGPSAAFDRSFLAPTPGTLVLARVLANLVGVLRREGDPTTLLRALELRGEIAGVGTTPRARLELAEALLAVGRTSEALALLEDLERAVEPSRRAALRSRAEQVRAQLN